MTTRIRTVKPELFRHEELFEAERTSGLPIRVSFIGLFCVCDRQGRFRWKPKRLKLDILPYDVINFEEILDVLLRYGFIMRYQVDSEVYGYVPNFHRHQVINAREAASRLPGPERATADDGHTDAVSQPSISVPLEQPAETSPPPPPPPVKVASPELPLDQNPVASTATTNQAPRSKSETFTADEEDIARRVIEFLNEQTGSHFRSVKANVKFVVDRLREGYGEEDLRSVVTKKTTEWKDDPDMYKYLRPSTLFNCEKFNQYAGLAHIDKGAHPAGYANFLDGWDQDAQSQARIIEGEVVYESE